MYGSRSSSIPYDILHGINFSANASAIFAYLSYFPPPPPLIPGPPAKRSWTCSSHSSSSLSCLVSDDRNPPSLRLYPPLINNNQSLLNSNTSHISKTSSQYLKSSPLSDFISNFFQNHLTLIFFSIIFLSIFVIIIILLLLLFLYKNQRHRQRQLTSNNTLELNNNNNKTKNFYHHLIPYRSKHPINNEHLTNHDSPVLELMHLKEQEEAL